MKKEKVKTEWASLSLAEDGGLVVCTRSNGSSCCIRFDSLEQLKKAINDKRISVKKWAVAVPRRLCILKSISLPASNINEAARMIEFEVPTLVPLSPDEFVYGCTPLNKQDNMLNVLVCILKLDTLKNYLKPFDVIGIQPHRIALDSLAIHDWFSEIGKAKSGPVLSIFINQHSGIVQAGIDGNLNLTNDLRLVDGDIESSANKLATELLRQQEELPAVSKESIQVLIAGTEKHVSELKNQLISSERAVSERISVISNPQVFCYNGDASCLRDNNKYNAEAVISAGLLDLAESSKYPQSNLLPQQYIKKYKQKVLLFRYLRTACLSLALIFLLWSYLAASNWRIERKTALIEAQIAPIEQVAGGVDSKRQRVIAIRRQLSNRGQITGIIDELYRYTPTGITISELRYEAGHNGATVDIKGQADSMPAAFDYTDAVSKAKLLNGIQVENVQQISRPGGSIVVFKAYCDIKDGDFYDGRDNE